MRSRSTRRLDLFGGNEQAGNFSQMASVLPSRRVSRSPTPRPLAEGATIELPRSVEGPGAIPDVAQFLDEVRSTGLLVLKDGEVRFERYWLGYGPLTQHVSFSVCKSFVATLIAFALRDGLIPSLQTRVGHVVPELRGSAYED